MSSAGANQESPGGTFKNVIDNPETKPTSHEQGEKPTHSHAEHDSQHLQGAGHNQESPGGTFKNVIDNPATKPKSHEYAEDQSKKT